MDLVRIKIINYEGHVYIPVLKLAACPFPFITFFITVDSK